MARTISIKRRHIGAVCSSAAFISSLLFSLPAASEAAYPSHSITMLIPYAPGGGTDLIGRAIAPFIQKYLGGNATIVVTNRSGASGAIAFNELARATPDGYTIGFINTPPVMMIPVERKTNFTWKSYDLLGNLVNDPGILIVPNASPFKTLADLRDYAKENPRQVTVATTGPSTDDNIAMMKFEEAAQIKMMQVPYKGAGEVRSAIAGNQTMLASINVSEALQYMKGGTPVRALGQMSDKRTALAPDIPTFHEQGFDVTMSSLRGLAAPKGLPEGVRKRLVDAVAKAVSDPEFQSRAANMDTPLSYLAPDEFEAFLVGEEYLYGKLWKENPWIQWLGEPGIAEADWLK